MRTSRISPIANMRFSPKVIPEPVPALLLGACLAVLGFYLSRRNAKSKTALGKFVAAA
jgi:hypothetical protein